MLANRIEAYQKDLHIQNLTNFSVPSPPLINNQNLLGWPKTFSQHSLNYLLEARQVGDLGTADK